MGIPQGWALSPLITNLVMEEIFACVPSVQYTNFLDDGVIGIENEGTVDPEATFSMIIGAMQEYNLALKPSKFK